MSLASANNATNLLPAIASIAAPAFLGARNHLPRLQVRGLVSLREAQQMAWRSSGMSNTELVENLWRNGLVTDPRAKEAFLHVLFLPPPSSIVLYLLLPVCFMSRS